MDLVRGCSRICSTEEKRIMFLICVGVELAALNHERTVVDAGHKDLVLKFKGCLGGGIRVLFPVNLEPVLLKVG